MPMLGYIVSHVPRRRLRKPALYRRRAFRARSAVLCRRQSWRERARMDTVQHYRREWQTCFCLCQPIPHRTYTQHPRRTPPRPRDSWTVSTHRRWCTRGPRPHRKLPEPRWPRWRRYRLDSASRGISECLARASLSGSCPVTTRTCWPASEESSWPAEDVNHVADWSTNVSCTRICQLKTSLQLLFTPPTTDRLGETSCRV